MNAIKLLILSLLILPATLAFADPVLDGYIREALENNPSYGAALERVAAQEARIPQAGALPDPMLGFGLANLPVGSWEFDQEPMTQKWIALKQNFPFPGTRGLQADAARDMRDAKSERATELKLDLIRELRQTWNQWSAVRELQRITEANQALLDQLASVATSTYRVGNGTQQDILRAQSASLVLEDRLLALDQQEDALRHRMRAILNRSPQDSLQAPAVMPAPESAVEFSMLQSRLENENPQLLALNAELAAADKERRIAGKQAFPLFSVGAKYGQRDASPLGVARDDFFSIEFGTTLPLFYGSRQSKLKQQREIEIRELEHRRANLKNKLEARLAELTDQEARLREQIQIYETAILPQAQQVIDAARADYRVGKSDFHAVVSAQQALLEQEATLISRRTDLLNTQAAIDALTGRSPVEEP